MTRWLLITALPLLLASCQESRNKQRAEIRKAFRGFSTAFFATDSTTAANYLSERTYRYYDRIIPLTRNADDARLSALPAIDLFTCLALRHRYSAEELVHLDSRTLVLDAFAQMTFPGGAPHFLDIGEISIREQGRKARAPVLLPPRQWLEGIQVSFVQENGAWKMGLTSVFKELGTRLEPSLTDPSSSRAEMALYHLQMHENEVIGKELLSPSN